MSILNYDIMQRYKPCSKNNRAKIEQLIEEVEFLELSKLIGCDIYNQLVIDCSKPTQEDDVCAICNNGLYKCISYLVYAQYLVESNVADTFTGFVQKTRQDSENIPQGTIQNLQRHYRDIAFLSFKQVKCAIERKYKKCTANATVPKVRIINIRKDFNRKDINKFDTNYFE
ncbi:MAG: hypothetical protein MJ197_08805 [Bacteroidales bacterium]|nr:hypothetical protein [Bacteroidales bacterium]